MRDAYWALVIVVGLLVGFGGAALWDASAEGLTDVAKCNSNPRRYLEVYETHTENLVCGVAECGLRVVGFSCELVPVEEL